MRFLISRLSSMGDVVCTLPAAVALKGSFPDSHITWVVDRKFAEIVSCCSAVDEVIPTSIKFSWKTWPRVPGQFDAAFDLQGLLKSACPIALCKSRRKLAYQWQREASWLFAQKVKPDPTSVHIVDQYVDVVRAAGAECDRAQFGLVPTEDALTKVRKTLTNDGFVAVNAGAAWASKQWPEERYSELVQLLVESGETVVMIGGSSEAEKEVASRIIGSAGQSMVGKTSISELIALLSRCKAHIGGDTGSTHMAAALGKPCVGLYSVTLPQRSCPYGQIDNCLYDPVSLPNISAPQVFLKFKEATA